MKHKLKIAEHQRKESYPKPAKAREKPGFRITV